MVCKPRRLAARVASRLGGRHCAVRRMWRGVLVSGATLKRLLARSLRALQISDRTHSKAMPLDLQHPLLD